MWRLHLEQLVDMLLILFLLLRCFGLSQETYADVFSCPNDGTRSALLHFAVGSQMSLCCQLRDIYCNTTTFDDSLTLWPKLESQCTKSCIAERMSRPEKCLVKFVVDNATAADEGIYNCSFNGELLVVPPVFIVEKPVVPNITSFSYNLNTTLTVKFDRGAPDEKYNDLYSVNMTVQGVRFRNTYHICNDTTPMCMGCESNCTCKYTLKLYGEDIVTISVLVSRTVQSSTSSRSFIVSKVIIPGPVMRFNKTDVSLHDANIHFCLNEETGDMYSHMATNGVPLMLHLRASRTQGIPEVVNVTITAPLDIYQDFNCLCVHFDHLTAFTNYTFVAFTSGGGGEGPRSKLELTTAQMVPEHPPLTDKFSFSRTETSTESTSLSALVIVWQAVPFAAQGSSDFSYYLEIESDKGFRLNTTIQDTFVAILNKDLPRERLAVKIWAQNRLGRSANYTTLEIPSISGTAKPYVIVELDGDNAEAYVNNTQPKDTLLAVHWCSNYTDIKNELIICLEYPDSTNYTPIADAAIVQMLDIKTSHASKQRERTYTFKRLLHYYELQYLNKPGFNKTVNASVTLPPFGLNTNIQVEADDYDYFQEIVKHDKDYIYFDDSESSRKKRNIINLKTAITAFVSLEKEDGSSNSGMIPVNCYFDRTAGMVDLVVSQIKDESDMSVTLRWDQMCNPTTSLQFLAKYFDVFSSTDEQCNNNQVPIQRVENTMFQPKTLKLPKDVQFACIRSCKADGVCAPKPTPTSIIYPHGDGKQVNIVIAVMVPVGCACLFVIIVIIYKWKKRGSYHMEKLVPRRIIKLPDEQANTGQHVGVQPTNVRTVMHSVSNLSEDSGRGTVLCEDDSMSHKNDSGSSECHSEQKSSLEETSGSFESRRSDDFSPESRDTSEGSESRVASRDTSEGSESRVASRDTSEGSESRVEGSDSSEGSVQFEKDQLKTLEELGFNLVKRKKPESEEDEETEESDESDSESKCDRQKSSNSENEQQKALKINNFGFRKKSSLTSQSATRIQFIGEVPSSTRGQSQRGKANALDFHNVEKTPRMKDSSSCNEEDFSDSDAVSASGIDLHVDIEKGESELHVNSDKVQLKALKNMGFALKNNKSVILQPVGSAQTGPIERQCDVFTERECDVFTERECDMFTDCKGIPGTNLDKRTSIHDNSTHNSRLSSESSLHRLLSSESESDGDCKRSLISTRHDHIC